MKSGILMVRNKIIPAGSICHIIQRAPGRELLFLEKGDHLYFIKLLKEVSRKHNIDIFCFALMSNHFHLLCRFNKDNASCAVKNLCERYAWFFNSKYKRKGHVFYGTFRASLCSDDSYLLTSSLYIHTNPVKAKLALSPSLYRWSSCSLYTEPCAVKTFIDYKFILEILHKDSKKAQQIYKNLLKESLKMNMDNALENPKILRILRRNLFSVFSKTNKAIVGGKNILTEGLLEKKIKELSGQKRLRNPQDREARIYLIQQLTSRDYSVEKIAGMLKLSRRTVYEILASS